MMQLLNKKILLLGFSILLLLGIVSASIYIANQDKTKKVKINFTNISSVKIYPNEGDHSSMVESQELTSPNAVSLTMGNSYIFSYTAQSGYESDKKYIDIAEKTNTITIKPYFSKKTLDARLENEKSAIDQALNNKYPTISSLYAIGRGKLYHYGEWYGTTLQYRGPDSYNADTLKVILQKKDNKWSVVSQPPSLSLSKYIYKNIPTDILSDVNNRQNSPLLDQFKDEELDVYVPN